MTSSRRPVLEPGEVITFVQSGVGLYSGRNKAPDYQNGVVYLTDSRICYVDSEKPTLRSIALSLEKIDRIEHYVIPWIGGELFSRLTLIRQVF